MSASTYSSGMTASLGTIYYRADSLFEVTLTVKDADGTVLKGGTFHVRPLNP